MIKKLLLTFLLLGLSISGFIYYNLKLVTYNGPEQIFNLDQGEQFGKINYRLKKAGLIHEPSFFYRYCQFKDLMTKFKAGSFLIPRGSSIVDIVQILVYGSSITKTITIPEGKNMYEIGRLLENEGIVDYESFIKLAKNQDYAKKFNIPFETFEGYLFPDTYKFAPESAAGVVITSMVNHYFSKIKDIDFGKTHLSPEKILILASIVEKETGAKFERPIISGVFHNRLKKRMRLQSDPTTIYGIYENFKGNLRKKDLQTKNEYNTYKIYGLPKGPICNPGVEAIKAAISPEEHSYLYFVSQNDGTHIFSKNYRDHAKAVNFHQKNRRNREGKSWRQLKN